MTKKNLERASFNNPVFKISAIIVALFALWGMLSPESMTKNAAAIANYIGSSFGWFYLVSVAFFVAFCLFLAFSKYGNIKLGQENEKPEFSFFAWISMLFAAGFGAGIVFWGVAEPLTHFANPPNGSIEPQSAEAARVAMNYSFFNWGLHQWSVFTLVGLALAYFQFRKKSKLLISETLDGVSKKKMNNTLKKSINILAVVATVTGVATSLGMGVLQINAGLSHVFSLPDNAGMQIGIVSIMFVLFTLSALTGVNKGIKILSNLNMFLVVGFMLFFLFNGPTVFILETFVLGIGDYITNFIGMSFQMSPYTGDPWVKDWTVFYWAWVITWSPFVGSFVARISRGRTIRQFVTGVMIVPPLIAFVWMSIFGGTGIYMDLFQNTELSTAVSENVATAIFVFLEQFPLYGLLSALMLALIMIFLVTSADSTVYVLGIMTSDGNENPSNAVKGIWAVLIAVITGVLIVSSGLQGLQSVALIAALPFTVIMLLISVSLMKSLSQEKFEVVTEESKPKLKPVQLPTSKSLVAGKMAKKKY
ncbi:choline/carnitine/betaine transporter [Planococcus antarcticus DSM 14505]|uniref:Choline/carnitine/betaine transporter n=1 Tax=Planococcus antarcticus DSM 14505 TaxID=1185653 RepID=A0A1C7DJZ4_9BACL|nr:BCCT family transporter [Planococcus antarcticus]ANU11775.1 glycine/betaine ABC transporter permease [Planococcus antarcticus DSM 14505]EIM06367.1 choline/carnitine/betaine transporter [Planococcus antarcticus DSM 14505]